MQNKKAEQLAEAQKQNTQGAREQAARQRAVKMAHDVGLKVWDPEDLDALDNLPRTAAAGAPARPGQAQITRGAVEAFLGTQEGNRMRTDMGLVQNDVHAALRDQYARLEQRMQAKDAKIEKLTLAAMQLRTAGVSMISYMDGAGLTGVTPLWREFFDIRRNVDSPIRGEGAASSAGGSSSGGQGPRRRPAQLDYSGGRPVPPFAAHQTSATSSQEAEILDDDEQE